MFIKTFFTFVMNQLNAMVLSCLIFLITSCLQFGENPSGEHLEKMRESQNYSIKKEKFKNRKEDIFEQMSERDSFWDNPSKRFSNNMLFNSNETVPEKLLPEIKPPDIDQFLASTNSIKFIWFGHSTILINIQGTIILIDPVFSKSASPVNFIVPRFQPPVLELEKLPQIDYILISHDHYDHLDMETVLFFKEKNVRFITPLGVTSHLKKWGISESNMFELDWWDSIDFKDVSFVCTPAQHFSGRLALLDVSKTLWASWVVKSESNNFYFSGDSGYDIHYKEIGEKHGPFDLVFMDSGQYNERWREVHNMPEEAIQGFLDLQGKVLVPIHWGMFNLAIHNWYDPIQESVKYSSKYDVELMTPKLGQLVSMDQQNKFEKWWSNLIDD